MRCFGWHGIEEGARMQLRRGTRRRELRFAITTRARLAQFACCSNAYKRRRAGDCVTRNMLPENKKSTRAEGGVTKT